MITRPLLAEEAESLDQVKLPCYASPKLDGIRCLIIEGRVLSRSFKEIPNNYIRECLKDEKSGQDGEILTYTDGELDDFNTIQSKVMREDGEPDFVFAVFDYVADELTVPFSTRIEQLKALDNESGIINLVPTVLVKDLKNLKALEELWVNDGHEGIMIRSPEGRYKCGRSTLKEGILLKFKRFDDSEAEILEIREQETNIGEKGINELGKTKRSHKKADKAPAGTTGEFWVRDIHNKKEFGVGTGIGLTKELRQEIWDNKEKYIGKMIKYKYQGFGTQGKPRFPSFQGFRDERDMS